MPSVRRSSTFAPVWFAGAGTSLGHRHSPSTTRPLPCSAGPISDHVTCRVTGTDNVRRSGRVLIKFPDVKTRSCDETENETRPSGRVEVSLLSKSAAGMIIVDTSRKSLTYLPTPDRPWKPVVNGHPEGLASSRSHLKKMHTTSFVNVVQLE